MSANEPAIEISQFFCRSDNYGVLVHVASAGVTISIDAPDAEAVERELAAQGWSLTHILTTHHHGDHVAGNDALKAKYGAEITGPTSEADRIPGLDRSVSGGDRFEVAGLAIDVLDTPGHTLGHIAYVMPNQKTAFVGDTLFAMGCGRVFEGTTEQMWASLDRLRQLPDDTVVYCGHEYTEANAAFALSVEPENSELQARAKEVAALRASGAATLPTTIGREKATNPFLRVESAEIRARLGLADATDTEVFTKVRRLKDAA